MSKAQWIAAALVLSLALLGLALLVLLKALETQGQAVNPLTPAPLGSAESPEDFAFSPAETPQVQQRVSPGFREPSSHEGVHADTSPSIESTQSPASGSLQVRVLDGQEKPISSEICMLRCTVPRSGAFQESRPFQKQNAHTNAQGIASFESLPVGSYQVRVLRSSTRTVEVLADSVTIETIRLSTGIDVKGLVVDDQGEPIAGAEIWLSERWQARRGHVVSEADGLGRFDLRAVTADNYIAALAPGFGISFVQAPKQPASEDHLMRIVLDRSGATLAVSVKDEAGEPIEAAEVVVGDEEYTRFRTFADGSTAPPPPPQYGRSPLHGQIEFGSVPLGITLVQARAPGFAWASQEVEVTPFQPNLSQLVLAPEARVSGRVQDLQGQPVALAKVWIGKRASFSSAETHTGPDGTFDLGGLAAGLCQVQALNHAKGKAELQLNLVAGGLHKVDLQLTSQPLVFGTLVDSDGAPLGDYTLVARESTTRKRTASARSTPSGGFELAVDPDKLYSVFVRSPGDWRGFPLLIEPNLRASSQSIQLRLPRGVLDTTTLRLAVKTPSGAPAPEASLELWHKELEFWRRYEGGQQDGLIEITGIAPGTLELSLRHSLYPMLRLGDFQARAAEVLDLGEVTLSDGGRLSADLHGLQDESRLAALDINVGRTGGEIGVIERKGQRITSSPLAPGEHLLSVLGDHIVPSYKTVLIESGKTKHLAIQLQPAGLCRFLMKVPTSAAKPPRWIGAQAWDEQGQVAWSGGAKRLEDGTFEARVSVPLGQFRLEATDNQGRMAQCTFQIVSLTSEAPAQHLVLTFQED